jgi:hypothetical protein
MVWRLILQGTVGAEPKLLNHAGLPLRQQLLWLAALPLFGACAAYMSRRAGGGRLTAATVALFPSIVMIPIWAVLATKISHPSPNQWRGLFSGVMNWIVVPGIAVLLGALPLLKAHSVGAWKPTLNSRTARFWLPGLVSLAASMMLLMISTLIGMRARFIANGISTPVTYIPWLLTLPVCGAMGAHLSRRAGGGRLACLASAIFPAIALSTLVGFLLLAGRFVFAKPQWFYFLSAILYGAILPSIALLAGAMPFSKSLRES